MPLFFKAGSNVKEEIKSMPDIYRYSLDLLVDKARELEDLGIKSVSLFPCIDEKLKNPKATEALNPENLNLEAIAKVKAACPDLMVMSDVALDPYNSDGHDGLVNPESGEIENDSTVEILAQMALLQAQAGSDIIGPSDMMDGRVGAIRKILEKNNYPNTLIMSYSAKYASAYYGPFRDALDSAPKAGDKKTYQMDFRNKVEALKEMEGDITQGADIVMVKPGLPYLDIVALLAQNSSVPVAVYNVSGEYSLIKNGAAAGLIDLDAAITETLTSFKRAGASMILSYFSEYYARELSH